LNCNQAHHYHSIFKMKIIQLLMERTWRVAEKALEHLHWCSVCDLAKIFLTSIFSYLLFTTSRVKVKRGLQIGGRLLVAPHLEQSNYLANQQQVLGLAVAFTSLCIQCKNAGSKPFCWAIQFSLQGHTLSTSGTALSHAWWDQATLVYFLKHIP